MSAPSTPGRRFWFEGDLPAPIPVTGTGSMRLPTGRSSGARRPRFGELLDAHGAFREAGADFQCASHGLDKLG